MNTAASSNALGLESPAAVLSFILVLRGLKHLNSLSRCRRNVERRKRERVNRLTGVFCHRWYCSTDSTCSKPVVVSVVVTHRQQLTKEGGVANNAAVNSPHAGHSTEKTQSKGPGKSSTMDKVVSEEHTFLLQYFFTLQRYDTYLLPC